MNKEKKNRYYIGATGGDQFIADKGHSSIKQAEEAAVKDYKDNGMDDEFEYTIFEVASTLTVGREITVVKSKQKGGK